MKTMGNPTLLSTGHGTLEGPLWDPAYGLLFADVTLGGVLVLHEDYKTSCLVKHRRGIGGLALHADGGIVVSGRNLAVKRPPREADETTVVLLENDPESDVVGYNDLAVDSAGRVYIGSLGFVAMAQRGGKPGRLHLIDLDGRARTVADDIQLTNGLGFSPDGRTLYHADSLRQVVFAYRVDEKTGDLGPRRQFVGFDSAAPDGLAVDSAGTVWVALPHSGEVGGFSPHGEQIASVSIREPMVTNVCFGGHDLRDLYIVSGSEGAPSERSGSVYRIPTDTPGLPPHRVRIAYRAP